MNPLFIPLLLVTLVLFVVTWKYTSKQSARWVCVVGLVAAVPAILFAVYYLKIFGEAKWFYTFRSWPLTEFSTVGIGVFAGWLQFQREQKAWIKRTFSRFLIPGLMLLVVAVPYAKQILMPADWSKYSDTWSNDVCLQSSESSCGPASAATILHALGQSVTEKQIAQESFTTRRGTENWYLLRTIRRYGINAQYLVTTPSVENIPYPAIAGVILKDCAGAGHFIAILGENKGRLITGDPLVGRREVSRKMLPELYAFTGFYIVISNTAVTNRIAKD